jgi:hypothetical protein
VVGKNVEHKVFGKGQIVLASEDTVSVHFRTGQRNRGVTRKFMRTALYDNDTFPRHLNAEIWADR